MPDAAYRAAYGVYRAANVTASLDADLAIRLERGADLPGDAHFQDARDLVIALNNLAHAALSTSHLRVSGNNATEGAVDCVNNVRSHPAFFIVFPLQDRNGDNDRFDSVHGMTSACAYAPGTALAVDMDDVVVAESGTTLVGWLNARAP
ncbi:MAG: hypothetical protein PHS32_05255 [Rhodoferax sp.]|uniref:hypothetical protein n=1 Tax=Rhodoferax sp. TaxID=50421 RepID=UPI002638B3F5|nr:hypothetical protein [Rhodoferax sp.]MDD5333135.1 hypothetical protein [Rhodoferax sp.]